MSTHLGNLAVYAARYAHHRNTGAALQVVTALKDLWQKIPEVDQMQIVSESNEATCNEHEWEDLRMFASKN